ncbi:MAG: nuclear transport factor 2 family protein [Gaiellaceae bacterium]
MKAAEQLAGDFVTALAGRQFAQAASLFGEHATLQALPPSGYKELHGRAEIEAQLRRWLDHCNASDLVWSLVEPVGDRIHVAYRFHAEKDGQPGLFEQHGFCEIAGGEILSLRLVCSGCRPRT